MFERPGGGLGFSSVSGRRLKQRGLFPFQEFLPSPGISSQGGWFWLLLNWLLSFGVQGRGGLQSKREAGADSEGELENQTLACQMSVSGRGPDTWRPGGIHFHPLQSFWYTSELGII